MGVERQYSGTLGKTGNCQVAVSLHHVGAQGSAALNWRLYLPESWTKDRERRAEAGIPDEVAFQKKWQLALKMIDEVRDWGLADRVVVADAGYGDATEFRDGLEVRQLSYAVSVSSQLGVWAKPPKIGRQFIQATFVCGRDLERHRRASPAHSLWTYVHIMSRAMCTCVLMI